VSKEILQGPERKRLLDALYAKYGEKSGMRQHWFYLRKKYSWLIIIAGAKFLKRTLDILVGGIFLLFFLPLMLIIALVIKLSDGGPIFYITNRVGKWGREFPFVKFRTMTVNADKQKESLLSQNESEGGVTFKIKKDPRITKFGRFLRKTSFDELPQLWSVIRGDMSLVGPRPPLVSEVEKYTLEERRRLDVKPGLTCIWQVSGRSDIPFAKQVKLDVEYIESQSLWLDIKLLLKTIPAVILGRGAY
jgi:lipopolysaccharide/colanic/teichoic acid biosynthesis glycosyltransferase